MGKISAKKMNKQNLQVTDGRLASYQQTKKSQIIPHQHSSYINPDFLT